MLPGWFGEIKAQIFYLKLISIDILIHCTLILISCCTLLDVKSLLEHSGKGKILC